MNRCFQGKINPLEFDGFSTGDFGVKDEEWNSLYCIDKSKSGEDLIVEELSRLGILLSDTSFSLDEGFVNVHIIIVIT
jgi:hypothetical protein